ncbi:MAG TPA: type II toxin-antitoxin system prevent-host-death family antitoxin [Gaiellaceae bacterium]|nr:type II toxin-antitoxin system prevent-host-death family antitoxin [Gaiellaceae bacterium]
MQRIGVRELRQHASRWLRRVSAGESFEVTDRGRPVALLVPVAPAEGLDALLAAGRARPGEGRITDLGDPLPRRRGAPRPSEALERLRADER